LARPRYEHDDERNNNYFTQLTTLDMTRRIRASEPLDSAGFFA
jgi:hypothetical protein